MSNDIQQARAVGAALRNFRMDRGWSLADLAERCDIPPSTLSKVETGKTKFTLDRLLRITVALDINVADLMRSPAYEGSAADRSRRTITRLADLKPITSATSEYRYHALDLLDKAFTPLVAEIKTRSLDEFGVFHRHKGEEFVLVLEGTLIVHTDTYAPAELAAGESIYFDSGMGHAYLNGGKGRCVILSVFSAPPMHELVGLTDAK